MSASASSTAATVATTAESIPLWLAASGITKAAILDDTYNGLSIGDIGDKLATFIDKLGDDDHLPELNKIIPNVQNPNDFGIDDAKILWEKQKDWPVKIKPLAEELLIEYKTKFDTLENIKEGLKKLGLDVRTYGTDSARSPELFDAQILLLDYQLDQPNAANAAAVGVASGQSNPKSTSVEIASRLAEGSKRPFLILISSYPSLDREQAKFRAETNYVGGTFGFLLKNKAANSIDLHNYIRGCGIGHPALSAVSDFMSTLQRNIAKLADEFGKNVLNLEVHDYSFIQKLSLEKDGEPLGEYILHLLSESLSHRLRNNSEVIKAREKLDEIHFKRQLPSSIVPSGTLSELYREAFTERGAVPLAQHPLQNQQEPKPETIFDRVMQGDIFHQTGSKDIYVLVNSSCQLQFSPINPKRLPQPDTTLMLVPGVLKEYSEGIVQKDIARIRTEPFIINDKPYRIIWNVDAAAMVRRDKFKDWCKDHKVERIARLRELYSAAIQQHWVATTALIGLQVAPPFFSSADCEVYIVRNERWTKISPKIEGKIILTDHIFEKKIIRSFTMTTSALDEIMPLFEIVAREIERSIPTDLAGLPEQQAAKIRSKQAIIAEAKKCSKDIGELFELVETSQDLERIPNSVWKAKGAPPVNLIGFTWEYNLENKPESDKFEGMPGKPVLIVNLLPPNPVPDFTRPEQEVVVEASRMIPSKQEGSASATNVDAPATPTTATTSA